MYEHVVGGEGSKIRRGRGCVLLVGRDLTLGGVQIRACCEWGGV